MMKYEFIKEFQFEKFIYAYIGGIKDEDFKNLVSFLEYDKPWLYDFKNENFDECYSESILEKNQQGTNIRNYFEKKSNNNSLHYDSSGLSKILYKFLWKWPLEKNKGVNGLIELGNKEEKQKVLCGPDTINSYFHIFSFIMANKEMFEEDFFESLRANKGQKRGQNYYNWLSDNIHVIHDKLVANKSEEEKLNVNLFIEINKFALLTHTIGNFILVPPAWNVSRNSMFGDYFDIFLENWKSGKLMLDTSLLKQYCEKFYLNLEIDNKRPPLYFDGKINSFLGKEKEIGRPSNIKEMLDYIENVNKFIEVRGKRLVKELLENIQIEYDKYKNDDYTEKCEEPTILSYTNVTIPVIIDEINADIVRAIFFKIDLKNDFHKIDKEILIKYIQNNGCILHNGEVIACKSLKAMNFKEKSDYDEIFEFFEKDDFAAINAGSIIFPNFIFGTDKIKRGELYRIPRALFEKGSREYGNVIIENFEDNNEKAVRSENEEKAFRGWSEDV